MIGADAVTGWLPPDVARDANGYILTGADAAATEQWTADRRPFALETSAPGVFAVGDVRSGSVKRVAAGVGEGGMAIAFVHQYLALQGAAGDRSSRAERRGDAMTAPRRPPFDAELAPTLETVPRYFTTLEPDSIPEFRAATGRPPAVEDVIAGRPVEVVDHVIAGHDGGEIVVSVFRRTDHGGSDAPGVYLLHGGGMVGGSRWTMAPMLVEWVLEYDAVAAAVEYRLAPEFPDPTPVEDCYAGLRWFAEHAGELGFDPRRAAGRRSELRRRAQRRDDAARTRSGRADAGRAAAHVADARRPQRDGVVAAGRRRRASGIARATRPDGRPCSSTGAAPPTCRSTPRRRGRPISRACRRRMWRRAAQRCSAMSAVAFASGIWAAGGAAELHIWAGGFHGFQAIVPSAAVSRAGRQAREAWVRRMLAP